LPLTAHWPALLQMIPQARHERPPRSTPEALGPHGRCGACLRSTLGLPPNHLPPSCHCCTQPGAGPCRHSHREPSRPPLGQREPIRQPQKNRSSTPSLMHRTNAQEPSLGQQHYPQQHYPQQHYPQQHYPQQHHPRAAGHRPTCNRQKPLQKPQDGLPQFPSRPSPPTARATHPHSREKAAPGKACEPAGPSGSLAPLPKPARRNEAVSLCVQKVIHGLLPPGNPPKKMRFWEGTNRRLLRREVFFTACSPPRHRKNPRAPAARRSRLPTRVPRVVADVGWARWL
jgi:hypothetical protein